MITNQRSQQLKSLVLNKNVLKFYQSQEWKRIRLDALARDNYECQRCKGVYQKGKALKHFRITKANTVHHDIEINVQVDLILELDNLVSLCRSCHDEVHGRNPKHFNKKKKRITDERW